MAFDFPANPSLDQIFSPPGGVSFKWTGYGWSQLPGEASGVPEAPLDDLNYVRKNAAWNVLPVDIASWASITGKPATFPPDAHTHAYSSLTGIPATFAPTLPIPSSGVTGLDAAQTAQDAAIGLKLDASSYTAADVLTKIKTVDGASSGLDADLLDGNSSAFFATASSVTGKLDASAYTAADVLAKLITVDGAGSLLDADFLDGNSSAFYATAASVSGKENAIAAGTSAQYWQGTKTWQTLDKAAVGLANVDNTSDVNKPVSTAQATADALALPKTGGTMTGDLTISKTTPALLVVKGASGEEGLVSFKTGANLRWNIGSNVTAESANAGSDFTIRRYNDAGTQVDTPLTIARGTGAITTSASLVVGTSLTSSTFISSTTTVASNQFMKSQSNVAPAAGGTANTGFLMFNTNILITAGTGAPTLSAPKGSLYLNTTATTNVTRMYVNTDGAATWTGVNTVA